MFKIALGKLASSKTLGLRGVLTSRSENLYGCNRYFIQPKVGADNKVPEGYWVDEDDLCDFEEHIDPKSAETGGPANRIK